MRSGDVVPAGPPLAPKRSRAGNEGSRAEGSFKIPKADDHTSAREYMPTPPEDPSGPISGMNYFPVLNPIHESSEAMVGPSAPINEWYNASRDEFGPYDDDQAFLTTLLSIGMEPEPVTSTTMSGVAQSFSNTESGTWVGSE